MQDGSFHSWITCGWQVKLRDPSLTRAILSALERSFMVERYTNLAPLPFLYLLRLTQLSLPEIRVDSRSGSGRRGRRSALHCDKAVTDIRSRPRRSSCRRNPRDTGSDVIRRRLGTSRRLGRPHPRRHLQHHTVPLRVPVETTAISHRSHTRRFNGHFRWNWFSGCPLTSFLNSIQALSLIHI